MARSWVSVNSQCSRARVSRVLARLCIRTRRVSGWNECIEIQLRVRDLNWLVLAHWDRCFRSDSFKGLELKERAFKGVCVLQREKSHLV